MQRNGNIDSNYTTRLTVHPQTSIFSWYAYKRWRQAATTRHQRSSPARIQQSRRSLTAMRLTVRGVVSTGRVRLAADRPMQNARTFCVVLLEPPVDRPHELEELSHTTSSAAVKSHGHPPLRPSGILSASTGIPRSLQSTRVRVPHESNLRERKTYHLPHVLAHALRPTLLQELEPPVGMLTLPPALRRARGHHLVPIRILRRRHMSKRAPREPVRNEQRPEALRHVESYRDGAARGSGGGFTRASAAQAGARTRTCSCTRAGSSPCPSPSGCAASRARSSSPGSCRLCAPRVSACPIASGCGRGFSTHPSAFQPSVQPLRVHWPIAGDLSSYATASSTTSSGFTARSSHSRIVPSTVISSPSDSAGGHKRQRGPVRLVMGEG
ncbi:hypothetical protein C2E23DRAFT_141251 [Lenzites betulinus]|nr:hypothetical protein C2E23DRAFT_141251 [Lenzites betulinus]